MTTVARGRWTSAPAPWEKAIGTNPRLATSPVIRIGRSRDIEASCTASSNGRPLLDQLADGRDQYQAVEHRDARQGDEADARRDAEVHPAEPERHHAADGPERHRDEDQQPQPD